MLQDHSADFSSLRGQLPGRDDLRYIDFVQSLAPRYGIAWLQLLCGHAALLAIAVSLILLPGALSVVWAPLSVVVGGFAIGYCAVYLQTFQHEAAHYLLAPSRRLNDFLANALLGPLFGQAIQPYREIHFGHHRHLGTPEDTEHTYFNAITLRFLLESLVGLRAIRALLARKRMESEPARIASQSQAAISGKTMLLVAALLHSGIVGLSILQGWWWLAAAWSVGIIGFYPFVGAVRQVLEHRREDAEAEVDYRREPHGAFTRMFGSGPIASTLGAAGFNRHLLHHWEPQVSFTRLRDLEEYLRATELAPVMDARRTTYLRAFRALFTAS